MRYTSSLLALLLLLLPALADSPAKSRRSYRLLQVRQHLAVPSATSCTDVDGDSVTDPELKDGDICVDTDDQALCFYLGSELYCLYPESSAFASQQRSQFIFFDDFLQAPRIEQSDNDGDGLEDARYMYYWQTDAHHWAWAPCGANPQHCQLSCSMHPLCASDVDVGYSDGTDGHLGVIRVIAQGDTDEGGNEDHVAIRTPGEVDKSEEYHKDWESRFWLDYYDRLEYHVLFRAYRRYNSGPPEDPDEIRCYTGITEKTFDGRPMGNWFGFYFHPENLSGDGTNYSDVYAYIVCDGSTSTTVKASNNFVLDDDWHHYSIIWDRDTNKATFYIDGTNVGSCTGYIEPESNYLIMPIAIYVTLEDVEEPSVNVTYVHDIDYVQMVLTPKDSAQR